MNKSIVKRSLFFLAVFTCIQFPIAALSQPAARSGYEAINVKQFLADRQITVSNPKDIAAKLFRGAGTGTGTGIDTGTDSAGIGVGTGIGTGTESSTSDRGSTETAIGTIDTRLRVKVDSKGRAVDVEILESSGDEEADRAAIEAARQAKYAAAEEGKERSLRVRANHGMEGRKSDAISVEYPTRETAVIVHTVVGLADDSVAAMRHRIELSIRQNKWEIVWIGRQSKCQPNRGHQNWAAGRCQ